MIRIATINPMRHIHRSLFRPLRVMIIGVAMLGVLTSCSVATLAYNNAGTLIGYALGDYVELTDQQETWLKERVNLLIAWHRGSELPQWQRWLNETRERSAGKPETGEVRALYTRGKALVERTTEQLLPDMAALLHQLEPAQIAFLEGKLARDNRKIAQEAAIPLASRQSKRVERIQERFENWMGSLTAEQAAYLQSRTMALVSLEEMRSADRQRWQREFIDLIKSKPELPVMKDELRRLILLPEKQRNPLYQAELNRQQEAMMTITAWFVANATPNQKLRLQKKLGGYAEDIASLLRT